MKVNAVDHVAVLCSDYERSKSFYTTILGCTLISETYREERKSWKADLAVNGRYQIELFSFPDPPQRITNPEARGLRHLAFVVEDLELMLKQLVANGVTVEEIRIDETWGSKKRFAFCYDPDNLPIELCEY